MQDFYGKISCQMQDFYDKISCQMQDYGKRRDAVFGKIKETLCVDYIYLSVFVLYVDIRSASALRRYIVPSHIN
jgi:hypothetical protein